MKIKANKPKCDQPNVFVFNKKMLNMFLVP